MEKIETHAKFKLEKKKLIKLFRNYLNRFLDNNFNFASL